MQSGSRLLLTVMLIGALATAMAVIAAVGLVLNVMGLADPHGRIEAALVILGIALSIAMWLGTRPLHRPRTGQSDPRTS